MLPAVRSAGGGGPGRIVHTTAGVPGMSRHTVGVVLWKKENYLKLKKIFVKCQTLWICLISRACN